MDIAGKRVLVVGGSGVLGGLVAAELAGRGARIALTGRDSARLAAAAAGMGGSPPVAAVDLLEPGAPAAIVAWAADELGGLDGIVNAAGVVAFGPLEDMDPVGLREVIEVDLTVPLALMGEGVAIIKEGFLVNISGVVAEQSFPGMPAYLAAKTGLSAATRSLAREFRRRGILVVDARPPHTETGLATRPVSGTAPRFPEGLPPSVVVRRIVEGIAADQTEIPAEAFGSMR